MTHNTLADLNLASLAKLSFAELQPHSLSAVLLALGSNYQADYHLPYVHKILAELGEVKLSSAFENPDITATKQQPKANYINQSVYLSLYKNRTLAQLQPIFKDLEQQCGRQHHGNIEDKTSVRQGVIKQVSMDIDILLVKLKDKQNSLSGDNWIIIAERYPLEEHDILGLQELKKIKDKG